MAAGLAFPVAYGMTRADGDAIGAWWEERRDHIQPSEFLLNDNGRVLSCAICPFYEPLRAKARTPREQEENP